MVHAALVASPGLGHAFPVIELGHRLVTHDGFDRVTVFMVTTDVAFAESRLKKTWQNPNLVIHFVPLDVQEEYQELRDAMLTKVASLVHKALPKIKSAILGLQNPPDVLIADWLGTEALGIADELKIPKKYVIITTSAWFLALTVYMGSLDKDVVYNYVKKQEPLPIPGCSPVQLEPVKDQGKYQDMINCLKLGAQISTADGVLVNTWHELEPMALGSFTDFEKMGQVVKGMSVQPVGPLVAQSEPGLKHEVLDWLDLQPKESVLYIAFGSGGTHTAEQMVELARGLEMSRQRFVWVIRPPMEYDAFMVMLKKPDEETQPCDFLPEGFLAGTREIGLVVPMWAPQTEILGHPSVGGFLTHCGWNSTMESIVNGIPMIAWPLYAEQRLNVKLFEELGVAVHLKPEVPADDGIVKREEIERQVRKVMAEEEGVEMRKRVKELKNTAIEAVSEGGSSHASLSNLAKTLNHV